MLGNWLNWRFDWGPALLYFFFCNKLSPIYDIVIRHSWRCRRSAKAWNSKKNTVVQGLNRIVNSINYSYSWNELNVANVLSFPILLGGASKRPSTSRIHKTTRFGGQITVRYRKLGNRKNASELGHILGLHVKIVLIMLDKRLPKLSVWSEILISVTERKLYIYHMA